ncbi:MAG: acyl--CoA ligase [Actinomycetota bacterium]|nr:acyl--CoA ligase [Actinomycetota bacterium]
MGWGKTEPRTVPELLDRAATNAPDRVALIAASQGSTESLRHTTYAEMADAARRLAGGLRELGARQGDRIGVLLDNACATETHMSYHAVHRLGAINVPLNTRYVPRELASALGLARVRFLVYDGRFSEKVEQALELLEHDVRLVRVGGPTGRSPDVGWEDVLASEPLHTEVALSGRADADWIFTSGTTGDPKAACFTHEACVACGLGVAHAWSFRPDDVYQSSSPFFTSTGSHTNLLGTLAAGCTYLIDPDTSLEGFLGRAEAYGSTVCFLVTSLVKLLVDEHREELMKLRKMRRIVYGGMAMPADVHRRIHSALADDLGIELMHLMGLTEGGPTGLCLDPKDHGAKPGSVGNKGFSESTRFCITDEEGEPVQAGEVGELCFNSPSAMRGYLSSGAEQSPFRDGWLHTGDLVRQDEEGYVYFSDRSKDIVRRGGLNISSAEVENVLKLVPGVADAAVIARQHPVLGEEVCAYVESDTELSVDDLTEHCKAHLANYKVPRVIRLIHSLPRNSMGRVLKAVLREREAAVS